MWPQAWLLCLATPQGFWTLFRVRLHPIRFAGRLLLYLGYLLSAACLVHDKLHAMLWLALLGAAAVPAAAVPAAAVPAMLWAQESEPKVMKQCSCIEHKQAGRQAVAGVALALPL